ncbi:hypothetical protein [Natronococcus occultus]|uniref:Uncharacterized protein n=1 Tax=Natronococcus occultus SP4 TaxID=694430 RepID=L0K2V7_9EURY|nr:hypothetical protein [Natronococcus occultus]AGB39647.1 hypothetical protein Natoc_3949 [Natronococcus occultus SP4]
MTSSVLPAAANIDLGTAALLAVFGLGALALLLARIDHALETFGGEDVAVSKTNCPACGARIAAEADRCPYCERSFDDEEGDEDGPPDYGWVET